MSNEREILYSLVNAFPIDIIFDPSDKLYKILRYKNGGCLLNKFLQTIMTDDIIFYLTNVRIEVTDN